MDKIDKNYDLRRTALLCKFKEDMAIKPPEVKDLKVIVPKDLMELLEKIDVLGDNVFLLSKDILDEIGIVVLYQCDFEGKPYFLFKTRDLFEKLYKIGPDGKCSVKELKDFKHG
jgi:hypothetical protein